MNILSNIQMQLLFIIIATNAGGEGKSMVANLLASMLRMVGQPVVQMDSDIGNWTARLRDAGATGLGWGTSVGVAPAMLDAYRLKHVIIDLGANTYASLAQITELLPELERLFGAVGHRTHVMLPLSTNKLGAGVSLQELQTKIVADGKTYVFVNRDDSGNFNNPPSNLPIVRLSHLEPGFQTLIDDRRLPYEALLTTSIPDIEEAQRYIADFVKGFVGQPEVVDLVSTTPFEMLSDLYPVSAPALRTTIRSLPETTKMALRTNQREATVRRVIAHFGWTSADLLQAAEYVEIKGI